MPVLLPQRAPSVLAAPPEGCSRGAPRSHCAETAGKHRQAGPLPHGEGSGSFASQFSVICNMCPASFSRSCPDSVPLGDGGVCHLRCQRGEDFLQDKRKGWGEAKPAGLHAVEASLTFGSAFSVLIWIIFMHGPLKWRKFNCAVYFLVFLPLSSANLPILMSFISLETITSPSPGLSSKRIWAWYIKQSLYLIELFENCKAILASPFTLHLLLI